MLYRFIEGSIFSPQQFDVVNALVFLAITLLAAWSVSSNERLPMWASWMLLVVGLLGFIADATIVYLHFLK